MKPRARVSHDQLGPDRAMALTARDRTFTACNVTAMASTIAPRCFPQRGIRQPQTQTTSSAMQRESMSLPTDAGDQARARTSIRRRKTAISHHFRLFESITNCVPTGYKSTAERQDRTSHSGEQLGRLRSRLDANRKMPRCPTADALVLEFGLELLSKLVALGRVADGARKNCMA